MKRFPPSLTDPVVLIATWFGSGLLPKAPGTWGSLAALPLAWILFESTGRLAPVFLLLAATALFGLGIWAAARYCARSGAKDPGEVVIDEVVGQLIALAPASLDPISFGLGFLLFRIFDVFKPWPVSWADRDLPGAWGIMIDDVLAGIYAALVMIVARPYLGGF